MIEIARLQNALLHSVPLSEYNRLLAEYKKNLANGALGGSATDTSLTEVVYPSL